jgi:hypothetical protein
MRAGVPRAAALVEVDSFVEVDAGGSGQQLRRAPGERARSSSSRQRATVFL